MSCQCAAAGAADALTSLQTFAACMEGWQQVVTRAHDNLANLAVAYGHWANRGLAASFASWLDFYQHRRKLRKVRVALIACCKSCQ